MFENIRIVLINTFHPGNIGSVARAMKTMGISKLYLVDPLDFPSDDATTMAVSANDLLTSAVIVETLEEAIADCALIVGTSARSRSFPWPIKAAREAAPQIIQEAKTQQVAIVFGRETMGMHNEELQMCNYHVYIPSQPEYKALNLAAAVQIISYEIFLAAESLAAESNDKSQSTKFKDTITEYCTKKEMDYFFEHLEQTLYDINFIIRAHPGKAMLRLKRLFNRARPEQLEMNMLRGILTAAQLMVQKNSDD